ncbi:MAG: MerR family transcriptional regulator [Gemmatimonadales bacterium]|nr:MAG: MerR family transcriptional regulator [Gemmatimonadales bacterium]
MEESLKVGELARRTGLTVRTLHHYEEIGLLLPARRNRAGHRLYGRPEVRRLHQIMSLKHLGLSLEEIKSSLDGDHRSLREMLDLQIQRIRDRIHAEEALCRELEALSRRLASGTEDVGLGELADSVGRTVRMERYYTREQLEALERRETELGPERIRVAQQEWVELFQAFETAMSRGKPPDHPDVLSLARRARHLIGLFTGGDEGLRASLDTMYRNEEPERMMAQRGITMAPGLWTYMQQAAEMLAEGE